MSPLIKSCSKKALGKNIGAEIRAGKPRNQAIAIGYSTLRQACGVETDKRLTPSEIVARGKRNESQDSLGLKSLLSDVCGLVGVKSRVLSEKKEDLVGDIMAWEGGELSDKKTLELFSRLVKNGQAWSLQGVYGRTAQSFIDAGYLDKKGNILRQLGEAAKPAKKHGPDYKDMAELEAMLESESFFPEDYITVGGVDYMMVEYGMTSVEYAGSRGTSKEIVYADQDTLNKELRFDMANKTVELDDATIDWTFKGYQPRKKSVAEANEAKHKLIIHSLHDVRAECPCGWHYVGTGERTRKEVQAIYDQHLKPYKPLDKKISEARDGSGIKKSDLVMYHSKVKGPNAIGVVTKVESLRGDKTMWRAEVQFRDFTQGYELSALRLATKAEKDIWLKLVGGKIPPVMAKLTEGLTEAGRRKGGRGITDSTVEDLIRNGHEDAVRDILKRDGWNEDEIKSYIQDITGIAEAVESKRTVGKKPIMSWDTNQIAEDRIKDIMENPGDNEYVFDDNEEIMDAWEESKESVKEFFALLKKRNLYDDFESLAKENAYADSDHNDIEWESLKDYLTEKMEEKNPDGYWNASVKNFGWRSLHGGKYFEAHDGEKLLQAILPDTDCTFYIYDFGKDGLAINNFHHDSPMGKEWYYIVPVKQVEFENEGPVSLAKEVQVGIDNGDFYTGFHSKSGPVSGTREEIRAHVIKALEGQAKAKAEDIKPEEFTKGDTFEAVSLELVFPDKSKLDVSLEIGLKDIGDGQYRSEAADFVNTDVNDSGFKEESVQEDLVEKHFVRLWLGEDGVYNNIRTLKNLIQKNGGKAEWISDKWIQVPVEEAKFIEALKADLKEHGIRFTESKTSRQAIGEALGASGKAHEFEKNLAAAIGTIKRDHKEFAKRENLTEEKLVETGEADQDYEKEFYDELVKQLAAAGYKGATHREFDEYQGVVLSVPGVDKFWVKDFFTRGEIDDVDKKKPYRSTVMTNPEGEEVSSSNGDYFQLPKDYVFKGYTLVLTKQNGETITKKNPKRSDLPDITDVMSTFSYKRGSMTEHTIMYPEHDNKVEIEVVKDADGKVQAAGLIRYCKTHKLKRESLGESWVGWESKEENEDGILLKLKDQYGDKVPSDLVVLDLSPSEMSKADVKRVDNATWYEVEGTNIILVSAKEINYLSETDPLDADVGFNSDSVIYKISKPLHRYNDDDGFYHA